MGVTKLMRDRAPFSGCCTPYDFFTDFIGGDPMVRHSFFRFPFSKCRAAALALAFFFFLGQSLGILFSGSAGGLFHSSMSAVVSSRVSVFGLLSSVMLPLLISAFAVYIRQPLLLIPTAFWKAFLFSYLGCGLYRAWGNAGWLVSGLVMFGSVCSMPVLCWYWLRHIGGRPFDPRAFGLSLAGLAIVGILDYCLILPFLAEIITF